MKNEYTFTVFTPTYNMENTIHRVYDSLKEQGFRDFQWIVVDDGSTDQTRELILKWEQEAGFDVKYIYQKNSGKHIARNKAIEQSNGLLFVTMDADDQFFPNSLQEFYNAWQQIDTKDQYSGIACPSIDYSTKKIIGKPFPKDVFDSNDLEAKYVLGLWGEKWGACRTKVLKEFPFPEICGQKYFPESYVWNQIARKYKHRYINIPLRIYHQETAGSLTKKRSNFRFPTATFEYLLMQLNTAYPYLLRNKISIVRKVINLVRFGIHAKVKVCCTMQRLDYSALRILFGFLLPVGFIYAVRDKIKKAHLGLV